MEPMTLGRRARKKAETRAALRAAAVELVAERGLDGVTIEDITDAADVSVRTFFNYFASKEEALTSPSPLRLAALHAALVARPAEEPPLPALAAVLAADVAELARRRDEWLNQISVLNSDPRLLAAMAAGWGVYERELAQAVAERLGTTADSPAAAVPAAAAVAALRVAIGRWRNGTRDSLPALVRSSFNALLDAVGGTRS
jgi:AcrR family transcriptional regulator